VPSLPPNRRGHHSTIYAGAAHTNNTACSDLVSTILAMRGIVNYI